jgi:hypothetical protein
VPVLVSKTISSSDLAAANSLDYASNLSVENLALTSVNCITLTPNS